MASERFSSRARLLEVVRILQEYTDRKEEVYNSIVYPDALDEA